MHVQPDGGLVALAGMPTRVEEPEPEPEDEDEMMDLWIDNAPLEMDYDDIATAGEADKSGEALQVSEGWLAVDCPDKLTSSCLQQQWIMFDWDSGWELGQIRKVKGKMGTKEVASSSILMTTMTTRSTSWSCPWILSTQRALRGK